MFEFCLPTGAKIVPDGPDWIHEIKYDGYRLRVERDGVDGISDFNALHVEGRITPAALSRPLLHQYPLSPMPFAGLRQACRFVFVAERTHLAVGK